MKDFDDTIRELAIKHAIGESSAAQLVTGLLSTGGGQVQFNIPEFGGMGQWMPGMVMAADMFNSALKARIDGVCSDIAHRVRRGELQTLAVRNSSGVSLAWGGGGKWWPGDLGVPASSGAQNNLRYAWFPATRRLAVDLGGRVRVYDTGDHRVSGVSQQQSGSGMTLAFTSQKGVVDVSSLPVASRS